jgi:Flp pilus assembly protein TadD
MARLNKGFGRLAAGVAALSRLAACSGGGGFKGASGTSSSRLAARSADAGDFQTAEALYRQAFEANPNSMEALVGLGRSYAGMGQYARAEQALNEANRRKPRDPAVLLELARTQLGAGQAQAALANLDIAAAKRPRDVQIITARGIALDRLSRHAEAQAAYREGLKRDPTDFALNSNLGLSLGLSGQTDAGIRILSELVRDGRANANTRGNLALVYGLAGREREAKATLAGDLGGSAIQNNLSYYRELRAMLAKGKPIGNLGQPLAGTKVASKAPAPDPLSAIEPVEPAPVTLPTVAALPKPPAAPAAAPAAATAPAAAPAVAEAPKPLPDFVPASGAISTGIVPDAPAAKQPSPLPTAPGE